MGEEETATDDPAPMHAARAHAQRFRRRRVDGLQGEHKGAANVHALTQPAPPAASLSQPQRCPRQAGGKGKERGVGWGMAPAGATAHRLSGVLQLLLVHALAARHGRVPALPRRPHAGDEGLLHGCALSLRQVGEGGVGSRVRGGRGGKGGG
jgi:hypothetical protein